MRLSIEELSDKLKDVAELGAIANDLYVAYILAVYKAKDENVTHAARALGIGVRTAQRLLGQAGVPKGGKKRIVSGPHLQKKKAIDE